MAKGEGRGLPWVLPVALVMIAAACFAVWFMRSHYVYEMLDYQTVLSDDGVWDVTEFDFDEGFVRLNGQTSYIAGALLSPEEFEARADEAEVGDARSAPAYTARLRILVPDDRVYMLSAASIDFSERIYVNGKWRQDVGRPALSSEGFVPGSAYLVMQVQPENGVIEIVRQSANFVHREGGGAASIRLGTPEVIGRQVALDTDLTSFTMGVFFTLALAHALLFAFLRGYRANLFLALLCLDWGVRTGVIGLKVVGAWFPALPWEVLFRLEYVSAPIGALLVLLVIGQVFPRALPAWFVRPAVALFGLYAIFCLIAPTVPLSWTMLGFEVAFTAAVVVIAVFLAAGLLRMRRAATLQVEHGVMAAGLALFMVSVVHDALYYSGLDLFGYRARFICNDLAMLVFALFAMIAVFSVTMRQVAQSRRAEQESRMEAAAQARANRMKEEFLRSLSHELQAPLTVVSGYAQLTRQAAEGGCLDAEEVRGNMLQIDAEAGRMERLVAQLLDAAALESGSFALHRKRVDVGSMLNAVADLRFPVLDDGRNAVVVLVEEGLPPANADPERLMQVALNLVSNAVRHTEGGTVTLSARVRGEFVEVAVADTGEGIADDLLSRLFERDVPLHAEGGHGLGLSIAARIVAEHGGTIAAESEAGAGTTVRFSVPVWREP